MVDDVGDEGGEGHPHGHLGATVARDARVYEGPMDVVDGEQCVEGQVDGVEAALSRQEVGQGEQNDARDQLGEDVRDVHGHEAHLVARAVPAVGGGLAGLGDEGDDGEEEAQDDQGIVNPEADLVVRETRCHGVVHVEQRVGNAVPDAALRATLGEAQCRRTCKHSHGVCCRTILSGQIYKYTRVDIFIVNCH